MDSLQEMVVNSLPPKVEIAWSLNFLNGATETIQGRVARRKPTFSLHLYYMKVVYEEISQAWATAIPNE
jgi:hypothetical protein